MSRPQPPPCPDDHDLECLRLEYVTTCVGFDDMLDVTLNNNHEHVDHCIVVTTHHDRRTHKVAKKYGATLVLSDLFSKNGRHFNKGAAINAGFDYFQYNGWRMHLDSDILLPTNFQRILFNHTHLSQTSIYGCDRIDVIGYKEADCARCHNQHHDGYFVTAQPDRRIGSRYVDNLRGYLPLGYFQLWNARCQKPYPYSLGTAAHDDTMFSSLWPRSQRHLLPTVLCYHLIARVGKLGENWDGYRQQPRLD